LFIYSLYLDDLALVIDFPYTHKLLD